MKIYQLKLLLGINEKWKNSFKGDLLENIFEEYGDINLCLKVFSKDWIPCWKEENKDSIELYDLYELEINKLDKKMLKEEYSMIRKFYIYQKDSGNIDIPTLEDIINWIDSMFDDENEEGKITLDLLTSTLDEYIYHNGIDS